MSVTQIQSLPSIFQMISGLTRILMVMGPTGLDQLKTMYNVDSINESLLSVGVNFVVLSLPENVNKIKEVAEIIRTGIIPNNLLPELNEFFYL